MKRVAIGQIRQETNTNNPVLTERAHFEDYGLVTGDEVIRKYGAVGELAGFTTLPDAIGEEVQWVGLCRAVAWSGGPLAHGVLEDLIELATARLQAAPVDGVLFSLHGAQAAVDDPDVSGRVLEALRAAIGYEIPLVASLDLHANLTSLMVDSADVLVGYHTYPHIDEDGTGRRAARVLAELMAGRERPKLSALKIPMVHNGDGRATATGIQRELWQRIVAAEARDDVVSVGLYPVQPWLDVPCLGWTLYQAYLNATPPLLPQDVARECWETRRYKEDRFISAESLLEAAMAIDGRPVAVSETSDSTNSGAPGDSTRILAELVRRQIHDGALGFCVDPGAVAHCVDAGRGASVALQLGGTRDPFSDPLRVDATVEEVGTVRYRLTGHGGHNFPVDMGRMSRIRTGDVTIVLVEKTGPGSSPLLYQSAGADPRDYKIVLAKSPEGFVNDYAPFAAGILFCSEPGCASPVLEEQNYPNASRPLFPFDDMAEMSKADWAGELSQRAAARPTVLRRSSKGVRNEAR